MYGIELRQMIQFLIVNSRNALSCESTAFRCGQIFYRMKAISCKVSDWPNHLPFPSYPVMEMIFSQYSPSLELIKNIRFTAISSDMFLHSVSLQIIWNILDLFQSKNCIVIFWKSRYYLIIVILPKQFFDYGFPVFILIRLTINQEDDWSLDFSRTHIVSKLIALFLFYP